MHSIVLCGEIKKNIYISLYDRQIFLISVNVHHLPLCVDDTGAIWSLEKQSLSNLRRTLCPCSECLCYSGGKKIHYVKTNFLYRETKQDLSEEGRENGEHGTLKN